MLLVLPLLQDLDEYQMRRKAGPGQCWPGRIWDSYIRNYDMKQSPLLQQLQSQQAPAEALDCWQQSHVVAF